jgi:hypothetical protein
MILASFRRIAPISGQDHENRPASGPGAAGQTSDIWRYGPFEAPASGRGHNGMLPCCPRLAEAVANASARRRRVRYRGIASSSTPIAIARSAPPAMRTCSATRWPFSASRSWSAAAASLFPVQDPDRGFRAHDRDLGIRPGEDGRGGAGRRACSVAAALVRKAVASMARVVHRYQESQRRTWCSSSPVSPLLAWKFSSVVQRSPAILTKVGSGTGRGL